MKINIQHIIDVFTEKGSQMYGTETVSQLEHALQCATFAETAGKSKQLITACLLHDFGHLVHDLGDDAASQGINDCHEYRAMPFLSELFNPAVTEPIRLHVAAKRYLCTVDSEYWQSLSPASKLSLELQGGAFSIEAAGVFIRQPFAKDAVMLRLYDDHAKVKHMQTPDLKHFIPLISAVLKSNTNLAYVRP